MFDVRKFGRRMTDQAIQHSSPLLARVQQRLVAWFGNTSGPHVYGALVGVGGICAHGLLVAAFLAAGAAVVLYGFEEAVAKWQQGEFVVSLMVIYVVAVVVTYVVALLDFHGRRYAVAILQAFRSFGKLAELWLLKLEPTPRAVQASAVTAVSNGAKAHPATLPVSAESPTPAAEVISDDPPPFNMDDVPGPTARVTL